MAETPLDGGKSVFTPSPRGAEQMGCFVQPVYTVRQVIYYSIEENEVALLSMTNDLAKKYLSAASAFGGVCITLAIEPFLMSVPLEEMSGVVKTMWWVVCPMCGVLAIMFFIWYWNQLKLRDSTFDRIKLASRTTKELSVMITEQ